MGFVLTGQIADNILQSITDFSRKPAPIEKAPPFKGPPLGSVYFGRLASFAERKPHYFMMRGDSDPELGSRVAIAMSPITTNGHPRHDVLVLPAGTLPPKRGPHGEYLVVTSFVLLKMRFVIHKNGLSKLNFTTRLEETLCLEASEILKGIINVKTRKTRAV
jgi:hypothetical protein